VGAQQSELRRRYVRHGLVSIIMAMAAALASYLAVHCATAVDSLQALKAE
jgi:hypothetical protein